MCVHRVLFFVGFFLFFIFFVFVVVVFCKPGIMILFVISNEGV